MIKPFRIVLILILSLASCKMLNQVEPGIVLKGRSVYSVFKDNTAQQLALAGARGDASKILQLVSNGADINYQNEEGISPLLWAFWAGNASGFEALLKNGANPNLIVGSNPMMRFFTEPLISFDNPDFEYTYDTATFLDLALRYGGDVNAVDSKDETMLMIACAPGPMRRVELLLNYGADIEKRTPLRNDTALLHAASLKQYEKVYFLLKKGADYKAKDKFNYDLVRIIEEEPFTVGDDPGSIGRKKTIQFLRDKGYNFVPYEDNPKNKHR